MDPVMSSYRPPSVRYGLRQELPQQGRWEASDEMRQQIWNCFWEQVVPRTVDAGAKWKKTNPFFSDFFRTLWSRGLRRSADEFPANNERLTYALRVGFQRGEADEFYDLLEFVARHLSADDALSAWTRSTGRVFREHRCAWRWVGRHLEPFTDEAQLGSLVEAAQAVEEPQLAACKGHYHKALQQFRNGDDANAAKEAITALESLTQAVVGRGGALTALSQSLVKEAGLHQGHKTMLNVLYGWTCEDGGIRHASKDGNDQADEADARFVLVVASAYINLVRSKLVELGKLPRRGRESPEVADEAGDDERTGEDVRYEADELGDADENVGF